MFGYVMPLKEELKVKEWDAYRCYYCSLCRAMKKHHFALARLSLTYDMSFLALLLSGVYEEEEKFTSYRCFLHPLQKKQAVQNRYLDYAADMNVLLVYYKCKDDWSDEKKWSKLFYGRLLAHDVKKTKKRYPIKAQMIEKQLDLLKNFEAQKSRDLDLTAGCFGEICAELFACEGQWQEALREIGFFLGKFIYLIDAYDDMEKDKESGSYNPLLFYGKRDDFTDWLSNILEMMMAQVCREFEKLPVLSHLELFRNILYAGVWEKYRQIRDEKKGQGQEKR